MAKKKCIHEHILVSPVEERGFSKTGLKDFRELLYYKVFCFSCKKEVGQYSREDVIELIKQDFGKQVAERG